MKITWQIAILKCVAHLGGKAHIQDIYRNIEIFKELTESELMPYQMTYEGFLTIPEVEQIKRALQRRQVSKHYGNYLLRVLWRICIYLQKHPRNLTIEECADLLIILKQKED